MAFSSFPLLPCLLAPPLLSLLAVLAGCSGVHAYSPVRAPGDSDAMADVARVRGLSMDDRVPVVSLKTEEFQREAHERMKGGAPGPGFLEAFAMGSSDSASEGARAIYDAELGGFYDPPTKKLYVLDKPGTRGLVSRFILEHETEHALQDRAFGFPKLADLPLDKALAARALYEGDATLTAALVEATRSGGNPAAAIAGLIRFPEKTSVNELLASDPVAARKAPPLVREELVWPYVAGTAFVAELASVGGWALVNAAFAHPPKTTEAVLHVEKYLAGELAIEVKTPATPDGYARDVHGTMGELATRVFVAQCSTESEAAEAARGWGGDSFSVVRKDGAQSILWATTWDDALAAARFAKALQARRACKKTGAKPAFTVVRSGNRVAFVQGLEGGAARSRQAEQLFALVGEPSAPEPPFPAITAPSAARPHVADDFNGKGTVEGGWFVDAAIGVRAPLLGMSARTDAQVSLIAEGEGARVVLTTVWGAPSEKLADATVDEIVGVMRKARASDIDGIREEKGQLVLPWTTAITRTLHVGDGEEDRVVFAPTCGGEISVVAVTRWQSPAGELLSRRWLEQLQVSEESPACEALKGLHPLGDASAGSASK
jgi:hypothetical protein